MNLNLDAFTYITGIASVLGLLLQFKDSFAEHREARKNIVVGLLGVFAGSLFTGLKAEKVVLDTPITLFVAMVGICGLLLAIVMIVGIFTTDRQTRNELFIFPVIGFPLLFLALAISNIKAPSDYEQRQVSLEELLALSELNESHANYDRALFYLGQAKLRLDAGSERQTSIDRRIHAVEAKQVGPK